MAPSLRWGAGVQGCWAASTSFFHSILQAWAAFCENCSGKKRLARGFKLRTVVPASASESLLLPPAPSRKSAGNALQRRVPDGSAKGSGVRQAPSRLPLKAGHLPDPPALRLPLGIPQMVRTSDMCQH